MGARVIEAIVFDMDGLLIDSEPLWQRAEIEIFAGVGIRLDAELCLRTRGRKIDEVVAYWYAQAPWRSPSRREVRDAVVERVAELVAARGAPKPGVEHALDFFAERALPIALASSSPYRLIDAVLARLRIAERFAALHSGEEERLGKPDPAIFLGAARKLAVAPARCLAFEDSPGGVASAKAAGMRCVAVPDAAGAGAAGLGEERASLAAAADLVIDSLLDFGPTQWEQLSRGAKEERRRVGIDAAPR
jgi:sugar-phosphatase